MHVYIRHVLSCDRPYIQSIHKAHMASLHLPVPIPISFRAPSLTRSAHCFTVSCNAAGEGGRGVDRRDLLLGIGGLYGATSLVTPDALAEPITTMQEPCGKASYRKKDKDKTVVEVECCPRKSSDDVVEEYKLPDFKDEEIRVRRPAHRVTKKYIADYERALTLMKKLPDDDPCSFISQANVHCAYCNGAYTSGEDKLQIHFSWLFFPWHRWYLYFYERILGSLIGDPTFALPFWNWDNPPGMTIPAMFTTKGSVLSEARRNENHLPQKGRCTAADLLYDGNDVAAEDACRIIPDNLTQMYREMSTGDRIAFYGEPYMLNSKPSPGAGAVERGSHTAVHRWCGDTKTEAGEDMGNFYSAGRDPLFFSHHANVDRLWTVWRGIQRSKGNETDFKQEDWLNTSFLFYDENRKLVRVKVKDSLDSRKMGYDVERMELPWLRYRPDARTKKSRIAYTSKAPKATDPGVFPVTLDRVVRVLVDRRKRSDEEKTKEEEQLVIEGIDASPSKFVRFEVFINDEDDLASNGGRIRQAEYAGAYAQVPHGSGGTMKSQIKLGLTELLEDLDVEDDDTILVSLVPRAGGKDITIGGVKIIYA